MKKLSFCSMCQPSSLATITLWPRLEIGNSSETPWSRPRTIACQYEINRRLRLLRPALEPGEGEHGEPDHERGDPVLGVVVAEPTRGRGRSRAATAPARPSRSTATTISATPTTTAAAVSRRLFGIELLPRRPAARDDTRRRRYQTERSSSAISAGGRRARVRLRARRAPRPPRRARRARPRGRRGRAAARSRASRASSSTRSTGHRGHRASGTTGGVEAHRRRQADRVHRAVRQPVAAADRLRHRVAEVETVLARAPRPASQRASSSCVRASRSCAVLEHARQPLVDRRRARGAPPRARRG